MATALKRQLIATLLNLEHSYISSSTAIYYNGQFTTIGNVVNEAINALNSGDRCVQEYYKTLLGYINNNNVYIVYPM
ncbi:MAG: hypothetical protein QXT53_06280 [Ignisphaera sp.]